jgi:hypothetical protein
VLWCYRLSDYSAAALAKAMVTPNGRQSLKSPSYFAKSCFPTDYYSARIVNPVGSFNL